MTVGGFRFTVGHTVIALGKCHQEGMRYTNGDGVTGGGGSQVDPHCGFQSCLLNIICTTINPPLLNEDRTQRVPPNSIASQRPDTSYVPPPFLMIFPNILALSHSALPLPGSCRSRNFTWTCLCASSDPFCLAVASESNVVDNKC